MTHFEIDPIAWRVAETLGNSFSLYSADEIAELEAAFRTNDPEELRRLYAKWAQRPTNRARGSAATGLPRMQATHALRLPAECEKHPYVGGRETAGIRPDCLMHYAGAMPSGSVTPRVA